MQSQSSQTRRKKALVSFGEHRKEVSISQSGVGSDLAVAVRESFDSLLPKNAGTLSIQRKSEDWGGEFIDIEQDMEIQNNSVFRAMFIPSIQLNQDEAVRQLLQVLIID